MNDEQEIKQFVKGLYENGKVPSDRFGISHEELGEMEEMMFGRWVVDEEPYELLKSYHQRADFMKDRESTKEFSSIKRYLKEKGYSQNAINNMNIVVLNELVKESL